jgi:hypothetical protein
MMKFPIINRLFPSYKWKVAAVIIGGVIVGEEHCLCICSGRIPILEMTRLPV